ncbi:hypothetical protein [Pantoea agglomerans]
MTSVQNFSPERGALDGKEPKAGQGCTMDTLEEIAALATDAPFPMVIFGNTDRAVAAAEALWLFARRTGLDAPGECPRTAVQDLVANLMHLCAQEGITSEHMPFSSLVSMAEMHFEDEV